MNYGTQAGNSLGKVSQKENSPITIILGKAGDNTSRINGVLNNLERLLTRIRGAQPEGVTGSDKNPNSTDFLTSINVILNDQSDYIAGCEGKLKALEEIFSD